jgi:hypothetical protein
MKRDALLNVVGGLEVAHEPHDSLPTRAFVIIMAGTLKPISRPIASMYAGRVRNDSRNIQIAAIMQGLQVIINHFEQIASVNQLASHVRLLHGFKGILA